MLRGVALLGVGLGLVGPANCPALLCGGVVIFALFCCVGGGIL